VTANIKELPARDIAALDFDLLDDEDRAALHERIEQASAADMRHFVRWMIREVKFLRQRLLPN